LPVPGPDDPQRIAREELGGQQSGQRGQEVRKPNYVGKVAAQVAPSHSRPYKAAVWQMHPGLYPGGLDLGGGTFYMDPGIYWIGGGGLAAGQNGVVLKSVDTGSETCEVDSKFVPVDVCGVLIQNSQIEGSSIGKVVLNGSSAQIDLYPLNDGSRWQGLVIYQDRIDIGGDEVDDVIINGGTSSMLVGGGANRSLRGLESADAFDLLRDGAPDGRTRLDRRRPLDATDLLLSLLPHDTERVEPEEHGRGDAHRQTEESGRADEYLGQPAGHPARVDPQNGGGHALLGHSGNGEVTSPAPEIASWYCRRKRRGQRRGPSPDAWSWDYGIGRYASVTGGRFDRTRANGWPDMTSRIAGSVSARANSVQSQDAVALTAWVDLVDPRVPRVEERPCVRSLPNCRRHSRCR